MFNSILFLALRNFATAVYDNPPANNVPKEAIQPPSVRKGPKPTISTAIVLNRSPFLTREPTTFERSFYAYQGRLRRALHNPVPFEFYFKEGSILETRFRVEEMKRERAAFRPSFGRDDDILDKEKFEAQKIAAAQLAEQEGENEEMMPREHPSDVNKDYKDLNRAGMRNLYLLVKSTDLWQFPEGSLENNELLHQVRFSCMYSSRLICFLGCPEKSFGPMRWVYGLMDSQSGSNRCLPSSIAQK